MTSIRPLLLPVVALMGVTTTPVFAQGSDTCATAQAVVGTGQFPFDTTVATTDGLPDTLCNFFSLQQINNDVWFSWIAPSSGSFTISTCSQTTVDTKIAVYDGSCAGVVLACNDDSCNLQTSLDVLVTGGNTYVIRLGNYPGTATLGGTGTFSIVNTGQLLVLDTQINPANGHTYHLLAAGTWTSAEGTAVALGGHLATVDDAAENAWIQATWQNYQGTPHDLWIGYNDAAVEGTFVWADGSTSTYTNWDPGEPNNALTGEDYTNIRRDNATGNWNDLGNAPTGYFNAVYGVVEINTNPATLFCYGDGSGTACPCANASAVGQNVGCLNSQAVGGSLRSTGQASLAADTVVLTGSQIPNGPGLYFQGTTQLNSGLGVTFGDGLRCTGGTVIRLGIVTASGNTSTYPFGVTPPKSIPIGLKGLVSAGSSLNYQLWYRDSATFCAAAVFNLTNALQITWAP